MNHGSIDVDEVVIRILAAIYELHFMTMVVLNWTSILIVQCELEYNRKHENFLIILVFPLYVIYIWEQVI